MKRTLDSEDQTVEIDEASKKRKGKEEEQEDESNTESNETGFVDLSDDLLFEVLKHFDAKSLGTAACVSKKWSKMAEDERLWELICTRHWANIGCGNRQLRSVVLALGGFRRLHSLYIWPILKSSSSSSPSSSSSSSSAAASGSSSTSLIPVLPRPTMKPTPNWGKDERSIRGRASISRHTVAGYVFLVVATSIMSTGGLAKHMRLKKLFDGKEGRPKYPREWVIQPPFL